jgi:polysaccharide export outer membrane protein
MPVVILMRVLRTSLAPLVALVLFLPGCASVAPSADPVSRSTQPYFIAPLDEAHITLADGSRETLQVSGEGMLDSDGMSRQVKGMPLEEFRALIRKRYPRAKNIEVEEFRPNRVTVLGEVFHQIHTELTDGPMRVMDAIAAANGFTPLANKRRVRLLRQNAGEISVYELDLRDMMRGKNLEQNLLLNPGDVITVPRNFL